MECKLITNSSMIVHRDCHTNDEHFMLSYVSEFKIVIEAHTSQCDAVFFSNQTPYIYIDFLAVFNIDFHKLPFISAPIDAVEYKLPHQTMKCENMKQCQPSSDTDTHIYRYKRIYFTKNTHFMVNFAIYCI